VTSEANAMFAAAQSAMCKMRHRAAVQQRRPNPAIDITPERTAAALFLWAGQVAKLPQAYRDRGALLIPQAGQPQLYCTETGVLEHPIDLSLEPTGSIIWTVVNSTVQGRELTMFLGAVRLNNGDWSLFRQVGKKRGSEIVFETDPTWYNNRVKRAKQHARQR